MTTYVLCLSVLPSYAYYNDVEYKKQLKRKANDSIAGNGLTEEAR